MDQLEDGSITDRFFPLLPLLRSSLHPSCGLKTLLSGTGAYITIPFPNPEVEKRRRSISYNYATSGIDYAKGTEHLVGGTHTVLSTDEEFAAWTA